ncbi:thiamine-phosphate kinase [Rhodococcus wratislaviensis]|nr:MULTISPECIES: thiamine-phosphate kinase [unclassified Rhodococcus (in: high G+C Gram-positive bacteria)]MBC2643702.1 thiamine-phosphate kinase [Rhodococcus sp. 3A]MBC2891557.1 thiamine-phosphate kinase [Rhodococcus sp. 4CII]
MRGHPTLRRARRHTITSTDSPDHTPSLTVADVGEFAVIGRAVEGRMQPQSTLIGPGDDAALVRAADGRVAVSADMLVQDRHFRLDWSSPREVGRKAVAQNAADVAAMGARPTAFLVSLGLPPDTPIDVADGISAGLGEAAEELGAGVVGGDLVQAGQVVISVTVLGDLGGRSPIRRSGARPGDVVAVAGDLGRSAAGLALHLGGSSDFPDLRAVHRVPVPPYDAAWAAADGGAHSMTDISDGLLADLGHICDASRVGMSLTRADLTVSPQVVAAAAVLGADYWEWVLTGGEDHGFAATFPADVRLPAGWTRIGGVHDGSGISVDGETRPGAGGWQSFAV